MSSVKKLFWKHFVVEVVKLSLLSLREIQWLLVKMLEKHISYDWNSDVGTDIATWFKGFRLKIMRLPVQSCLVHLFFNPVRVLEHWIEYCIIQHRSRSHNNHHQCSMSIFQDRMAWVVQQELTRQATVWGVCVSFWHRFYSCMSFLTLTTLHSTDFRSHQGWLSLVSFTLLKCISKARV